jgi:ribosomal protein L16 Arg81 hydroxylase
VLGWQRFNEVLALTPYWNEDTLKVYFRSRAALRENYCDTTDLRPGTKASVDPAKVKALLGVGASLIANHIHRVCPEVAAVAHVLEREFAARVAANAYCSFKGVQAFQTHFDLHDVFALQVEGEKTWHVYETRADAPVTPLPPGDEVEKWLTASRGRLLFEADMKPGDILYLPRGQYHDALTGAQASLHVSFGVTPATGLALFKLLESAVTAESAFRQYLPDARNEAALRERLAALAERVKTIMTSPAFATDVLNHQRSLAGARAEYELPAQPQPTWYQVARRAQVVRRDSGYVAITEQGEVALGATHSTVEWLLKQRLFSLGDALARHANMDAAQLRSVLGKLLAAGVIVETELRSDGRLEGNA